MHPSQIASRRAIAIGKITERATALVDHLELGTELVQGMQPTARDASVADLQRLETWATLLDQVAFSLGVPAPPETVTAVTEYQAPAEEPAADELPAPVLDEEPAGKKTRRAAGGPVPRDVAPTENDQVETFVPAKKAGRPATRSTSKKK